MRIYIYSWPALIFSSAIVGWLICVLLAFLIYPMDEAFFYVFIGSILFAVIGSVISVLYITLSEALRIEWSKR